MIGDPGAKENALGLFLVRRFDDGDLAIALGRHAFQTQLPGLDHDDERERYGHPDGHPDRHRKTGKLDRDAKDHITEQNPPECRTIIQMSGTNRAASDQPWRTKTRL